MLCCPARLPTRASRRLPGGDLKKSSVTAASSIVNFRSATGLPSLEQRLGFIASKRLDSHQIDLIDIGVNFIPFTGKRQRIRSSTRTGRTQKLTRSQITLTERLRQFPPHVGPNLAWRGRPSIQCDLGVPWQADECAVCLNTAPGFEEPLSPEIDLPHQPLKACRFLNLQAFPLLIHALPTPQGA
jgi:hypothetical protein